MIQILRATAADTAMAAPLAAMLMAEEGTVLDHEGLLTLQAEMVAEIRTGKGALWLAIHPEAGAVGLVQLTHRENAVTGPVLECHRLFILPAYRRTRAARLLIEAATAAADPQARVMMTTRRLEGGHRFHRKMGFTPLCLVMTSTVAQIRAYLESSPSPSQETP